jgi:uncharacterized membrane protein YdcZ (DUF606 family)
LVGLIVWIGVVLAFSFVEQKNKTSPALVWMLGFVAGLVVFLAFYLLFWIGVVVTIIVIIISNFLKKLVGGKR